MANIASAGLLSLFIVVYSIAGLLGLGIWILQSLGTMWIGKAHRLPHSWMAFVPIFHSYYFGRLSDDCNARRGKKTHHAQWLLWTGLISVLLAGGMVVVMLVMIPKQILRDNVSAFDQTKQTEYATQAYSDEYTDPFDDFDNDDGSEEYDDSYGALDPFDQAMPNTDGAWLTLGTLAMILSLIAVSIVCAIFTYLALWSIFRFWDEEYAVLWLVLSIFVDLVMPIVLFVIGLRAKKGEVPRSHEAQIQNAMQFATPPSGDPTAPDQAYAYQPYTTQPQQVQQPQQAQQAQQQPQPTPQGSDVTNLPQMPQMPTMPNLTNLSDTHEEDDK